jgi:uncharacterized coiled-coil protein SlyX
MVDYEVESALREIRERVVAESARKQAVAPAAQPAEPSAAYDVGAARGGGGNGEALARLRANLSTTERAWSRLPPLLSYRGGAAARLELWVKRRIKRALHWFTWEQVNFNSATHHALGDALAALESHERVLAAYAQLLEGQGQLINSQGQLLDAQGQSINAHGQSLAAHEQRLTSHEQVLAAHERTLAALRDELRRQRAEAESGAARLVELRERLASAEAHAAGALAGLRGSLEELAAALREEQQTVARARADELLGEMRERVGDLLEEQRVCFRQLSLEATEAAARADRDRRQIEARIEALEANHEKKSGV